MDEKGHALALAMIPLQPLQPHTPFLSAQSTAGMNQGIVVVLAATSQTAAKVPALGCKLCVLQPPPLLHGHKQTWHWHSSAATSHQCNQLPSHPLLPGDISRTQ